MIEQTIKPLNIAGATLIIQFLLVSSLIISSKLYQVKDLTGWIISVLLISLAIIFVCEDFSQVWEPLFAGTSIFKIPTIAAINIVFAIDIALVAFLIRFTGGSYHSPFSQVLFLIPSLSIFLRLPATVFLAHAAIVGAIYLWFLRKKYERHTLVSDDRYIKRAIGVMSISCLAIAILVGYITKPVSINEIEVMSTKSQYVDPERLSINP